MWRGTWSRKCWPELAYNRPRDLSFAMTIVSAFDELCSLSREASLVESVEAALGWDERTYMPPAAGEYRAEQMTFLTGLAHQKRTTKRLGDLLGELTANDLAKD